MEIYITGDIHCPYGVQKLNNRNFPEQKLLERDDYLIILGDFGLYWKDDKEYRYWLKWFKQKKYTILWLDGNHENHHWINSFSVTEWHGGKVHQTEENIIHLMRGEVYELAGKKFFVCGGASSTDKEHRVEGVSWWPEENISEAERENALTNLAKHGNKVDYILSHTIYPEFATSKLSAELKPEYIGPTENFLADINKSVEFEAWYFGHYHKDVTHDKYHCMYYSVEQLI